MAAAAAEEFTPAAALAAAAASDSALAAGPVCWAAGAAARKRVPARVPAPLPSGTAARRRASSMGAGADAASWSNARKALGGARVVWDRGVLRVAAGPDKRASFRGAFTLAGTLWHSRNSGHIRAHRQPAQRPPHFGQLSCGHQVARRPPNCTAHTCQLHGVQQPIQQPAPAGPASGARLLPRLPAGAPAGRAVQVRGMRVSDNAPLDVVVLVCRRLPPLQGAACR